MPDLISLFFFFFNDTATTEIYTLSLHDALPIFIGIGARGPRPRRSPWERAGGSEAATSCRSRRPGWHRRDVDGTRRDVVRSSSHAWAPLRIGRIGGLARTAVQG